MAANNTNQIFVIKRLVGVAAYSFSEQDDLASLTQIPGGGTTLTLPKNPIAGDRFDFADADGSCAPARQVKVQTIDTTTIRGAASASFTVAFAASSFRFDGFVWIQEDSAIVEAPDFYQTVQTDGVAAPQERILDLKSGAGIAVSAVDNPGANRTEVTVASTGDADFYQTMQVNGAVSPQEPVLDLVAGTGIALTPADDAGVRTRVLVTNTAPAGPPPFSINLIEVNDGPQPQEPTLDLKAGLQIALAAVDNPGSTRTEVTISVTPNDIFGTGSDGVQVIAGGLAASDLDATTLTVNAAANVSFANDRPVIWRATQSITIGAGAILTGGLNTVFAPNRQIGSFVIGRGGGGAGSGSAVATAGIGGLADGDEYCLVSPFSNTGTPIDPGKYFINNRVSDLLSTIIIFAKQAQTVGYSTVTQSVRGASGAGGAPGQNVGGAGGNGVTGAPGVISPSFSDTSNVRAGVLSMLLLGGCPGATGLPGGLGADAALFPGGGLGGNGGAGGAGGQGGGAIYLVAPSITFGAGVTLIAAGQIGALGTAGSAGGASGAGGGGGGAGGQGGSGGLIAILFGNTLVGAPAIGVAGGGISAGGGGGAGGAASVTLGAGGVGGTGATGCAGATGFTFTRQVGQRI